MIIYPLLNQPSLTCNFSDMNNFVPVRYRLSESPAIHRSTSSLLPNFIRLADSWRKDYLSMTKFFPSIIKPLDRRQMPKHFSGQAGIQEEKRLKKQCGLPLLILDENSVSVT